VGQLCHNYSVQMRTNRWPLAYFYNCLNLADINAQVVFVVPRLGSLESSRSSHFPWEPWPSATESMVVRKSTGTKTSLSNPKCTETLWVCETEPHWGRRNRCQKVRRCRYCPLLLDREKWWTIAVSVASYASVTTRESLPFATTFLIDPIQFKEFLINIQTVVDAFFVLCSSFIIRIWQNRLCVCSVS